MILLHQEEHSYEDLQKKITENNKNQLRSLMSCSMKLEKPFYEQNKIYCYYLNYKFS